MELNQKRWSKYLYNWWQPIRDLKAPEATAYIIEAVPGSITPFRGGTVRSGSKVGSNKYKFLNVSTNEKICVTIKDKIEDSDIQRM